MCILWLSLIKFCDNNIINQIVLLLFCCSFAAVLIHYFSAIMVMILFSCCLSYTVKHPISAITHDTNKIIKIDQHHKDRFSKWHWQIYLLMLFLDKESSAVVCDFLLNFVSSIYAATQGKFYLYRIYVWCIFDYRTFFVMLGYSTVALFSKQ